MEKNNWSNKKVGGFWIKKTKADRQYLSGTIEIKLKDVKKFEDSITIEKG